MSKLIKQMEMDALKGTLKEVRDLVLVNIVGLNAIDENKVRLGLRKKGIRLHKVKNSLARRVFGELGLTIDKGWEGSTTLAWGAGSVAELSKEIEGVAKKHEKFVKVKGAVADGQQIAFDTALKMPTRIEAIGQVLTLALSPARRIAGALLGPAGYVAGQVKQVSEKKEEAAPAKEGTPVP